MVSDYTPPPVTQATLKGAPYVTVSPVGLAQGLPRNNNANYGPDTPGTTTCGIQEAITYVYNNAVTFSGKGGPSLLMQSIRLLSGSFNIGASISIPAPASGSPYGPNIHIFGDGMQNTILNFNLNNAYGFVISSNNQYGMFVFEGFSPNSGIGYTPSGWLNANFFGTANAAKANMVIRDVNVYPATWSSFSLVATGLIQLVLQNYWDTTSGTSQNGPYLGNTVTLWNGGACYSQMLLDNNYVFKAKGTSTLNLQIITGNGSYIFDGCVDVRISTGMGTASPIRYVELSNCIITNYVGATSNTIWAGQSGTISTLRVKDLTFSGTSDGSLLNSFITATDYQLDGVLTNTTSYTYTMPTVPGFGTTTPAVGASTVDVQNTNPFPVRIYLLTGGTGTAFQITDPSGTAQAVTVALAAGMEFTLDPGAKIQFTYTAAPTWKWYGV